MFHFIALTEHISFAYVLEVQTFILTQAVKCKKKKCSDAKQAHFILKGVSQNADVVCEKLCTPFNLRMPNHI